MKSTNKALILVLISMFLLNISLYAETIKEAKIKTNAHCGNCKTKIEAGLGKIDGIKSATVEMSDKVATISYDADKIKADAIKKSIVDMGYKAELLKSSSENKEVKRSINDGKKSIQNIIK